MATGKKLYAENCAMCHGPKLNGAGQSEMPPSPAIAGATFLRKFSGSNVAALFAIVRRTMPPDAPGTLTDQQSIDAIAHMFAVSGMPAGDYTAVLTVSYGDNKVYTQTLPLQIGGAAIVAGGP